MFKYAAGRFVNPVKIIGASVYQKDGGFKVAIDLDVVNVDRKAVYSDSFPSSNDAEIFINTIPCNHDKE